MVKPKPFIKDETALRQQRGTLSRYLSSQVRDYTANETNSTQSETPLAEACYRTFSIEKARASPNTGRSWFLALFLHQQNKNPST